MYHYQLLGNSSELIMVDKWPLYVNRQLFIHYIYHIYIYIYIYYQSHTLDLNELPNQQKVLAHFFDIWRFYQACLSVNYQSENLTTGYISNVSNPPLAWYELQDLLANVCHILTTGLILDHIPQLSRKCCWSFHQTNLHLEGSGRLQQPHHHCAPSWDFLTDSIV